MKPDQRASTAQHSTAHNIFEHLTDHARQIEQHWTTIFQGLCEASEDYPHLDIQHFNSLNEIFTTTLEQYFGQFTQR